MLGNAFKLEIEVAVDLARKAAFATEAIRKNGIESMQKGDGTPLTQADLVSQAVILAGLKKQFPEDKIKAEEELKGAVQDGLKNAAVLTLRMLGVDDAEAHLKEFVNYRGNAGGRRIWMIDPIDGTKGFKKGLSYAIALGLYYGGRPQFGCMAVPRFPDFEGPKQETAIAYAGTGIGAHIIEKEGARPQELHVSDIRDPSRVRIVGSRAHDREDISGKFGQRVGAADVVRMDSMAKYLMLASGRADIYLKKADPEYGIAYPWDHCAGQIILEQAGGKLTTFGGKAVNYEQKPGSPIKDLKGMLASNGACHKKVLEIVNAII